MALVTDPYVWGHVQFYDHDGVSWQWGQVIWFPESATAFGAGLDLDGDLLAVGDPFFPLAVSTGVAYLYRSVEGQWNFAGKLTASDGLASDNFGWQCAVSGDRVLVGAPRYWETDVGGKAYVFEAPDVAQVFCTCSVASPPCSNYYSIGGCENSRELGGILGAWGSASVGADDLVLSATQLPFSQFGLVCMGDAVIAPVVLDDGLFCLGGNLFRFPPRATGPGGTFGEGPGIVAHSASFGAGGTIVAGSTWHFQAWVRDPGGPCGQGSNTTNALSVTFTP